MKRAIVFLGIVFSLTACDRKPDVTHLPREEAVKIAKEAAQDAFQQLSSELAEAIENGGPVSAIPVCSLKAETIVQEVAEKRQLEMIRLSDRPRNPKQMAHGDDIAAMNSIRAAKQRGETPSPQVDETNNGYSIVRIPIPLSQPLCLQCHGAETDITPETRKAILTSYPEDKATGYKLNDLRGIWRIEISNK
jgi:Protein of unknown function (DUF3365)